jgi:hypothetical protein
MTADQATSLYKEMGKYGVLMEEKNERYHIIFNSCITNTYKHLWTTVGQDFKVAKVCMIPFLPKALVNYINCK